MKTIEIPAFMFDCTGDWFLVGIEPNGKAFIDGGHDTKQDVAQAKELYESIGCIRPLEETRYLAVKIEKVPAYKGRLNDKAIRALNAMR